MATPAIFLSSVWAGICVSIGGTVFLALENKVLGALFFTVGLFVICTFGLHLFTGKVCYVFANDKKYLASIPVIWLGNLVGCAAAGIAVRSTRVFTESFAAKAQSVCQAKLDDGMLSLFILGMFCNMLIYIGVEGFKTNPHEVGKYVALFFGVIVFILCGFEHCVANMFYFTVAGVWSVKALVCLLVISLGNAVGGILIAVSRAWLLKQQ